MELKQLRYFVRIVEMGSLSKAAIVVGVAQSALSNHIASLEEELAVALLDRTGRGVKPTEEGSRLYRHAQELLQCADDTKARVKESSFELTGVVSIGMPLSLTTSLALPIVSAVRARYPRIRLQVHEETADTVFSWMHTGRLNAGIIFDDTSMEGLATTPLFEECLFLVVHRGSKIAGRESIDLAELADIPLLTATAGKGVRTYLERSLAKLGLSLCPPCAELNSIALQKQAAAAGIAPTVLGWGAISAEVEQGLLTAVEIVNPSVRRTALLCAQPALPRTKSTERVLSMMEHVILQHIRSNEWRGVKAIAPPPD
ncbi:LysR family transcriptional regulator [Variovorax sp. E3]|uniref:LysR family transcriptional regulator n=1 Tax=Variovorax sp. E3 TaxID=1914993 RepID=UPI0018DCF552|nr:LysR substrate-binding domain-containing protein [Variovorax sp. E3]